MPETTVITNRCWGMLSFQFSSSSSAEGLTLSPRMSIIALPSVWLDAGRSSSMRSPHILRMALRASSVDPSQLSMRSLYRMLSIFCTVSMKICCSIWRWSLDLSIACRVPVSGLSLNGRSPKVMVWSGDVSVSETIFRLIVPFERSTSLTARCRSSFDWEGSVQPRCKKIRGASVAFTPKSDTRGLTHWTPFLDIIRRLYSSLTATSVAFGYLISQASLKH